MAVEIEEFRELIDFVPEGLCVTSFYLNVDAREFPDPEHTLTSLDSEMHAAHLKREEVAKNLSHEARESLGTDLERIDKYVREDFDRSDTNGLAIFSCSAKDFWEVIQMPSPVVSSVLFGPRPVLAPIARFVSHTKSTAILLTDKQHARIFTIKGAEVREWTDFEEFVPHRSQAGGWSQMRYQRHSDTWAKHHVDHAAELVLKLLAHYPFDWVILGVEVEQESELLETLHPYVKDRVIGRINVRIDAPASEVVAKAAEVREEAETHLIDKLLKGLQEYAGAGGRGSVGLSMTLEALNEQRIHILLVQDGFKHPGAECLNCGLLIDEQTDTCPACNEPAQPVEDVVSSAVQKALELGAAVEVATEQGKLDEIFGIGAILYY